MHQSRLWGYHPFKPRTHLLKSFSISHIGAKRRLKLLLRLCVNCPKASLYTENGSRIGPGLCESAQSRFLNHFRCNYKCCKHNNIYSIRKIKKHKSRNQSVSKFENISFLQIPTPGSEQGNNNEENHFIFSILT